ncbi:hypothetical protein WSM22_02350 [Cytophagales bacterium WSM2-2]|nr:hypothetical protein WSM22_02350 [Cytophagales bacterium WSM2-2]
MKVYSYTNKQFLPIAVTEAWDFFSSPRNLVKITPDRMNFKILSISMDRKVYSGQIIQYKVSVLPGIRLRWVTEIKNVKEHDYFIDDQITGPYAIWYHQHHFRSVDGGTEMIDEVSYALPMGFLGRFAHWLFVKREIDNIFEYRRVRLSELFPNKKA